MTVKPAQVMVVTPHPDDAESAVAGSVARWIGEGKDVVYVVCTNGDKGTSDVNMKPEKLAVIREREQLAAAKVLGVREVIFLRHPDQALEDTPEFREEIIRLITMYQPETVVTTDPYRRYIWHRDHRVTGQVVLDTISSYASDSYSHLDLLGQGLQHHSVKELLLWASEEPNCRSNITDTFEIKIAALGCHKSQVGDTLSPESKEGRRERHKMMAQGEDYELAEAFHRVELYH